MNDYSDLTLGICLLFLIALSAFFSSSETSMMSVNRYRIKHQASEGNKSAIRILKLVERPDKLLGAILIGNNFVNILASAIATVLAIRLFGDAGVGIATGVLTILLLVFAEVTPKTLAAIKPELIAKPASVILSPLMVVLFPFVFTVNKIAEWLLKLINIPLKSVDNDSLTPEELRTLVVESRYGIPREKREMLLGIMDLEHLKVDDIMIPRNEIFGLDLNNDLLDLTDDIRQSRHTRMPVWKGDIDQTLGILHLKKSGKILEEESLTKATILSHTREPWFVPEGTRLHMLLANFQRKRRRIGMVVDEYGEIIGMVTLEDILEEIVGDFTTDLSNPSSGIHPQKDGSFILDGSLSLKHLQKKMKWQFPHVKERTLNGLILHFFQAIPPEDCCIKIGDYYIEILRVNHGQIHSAKVTPINRQLSLI